ncbi:MAG: lipopolysaccharide heptosyltransferase II [Ghiorsea sp.]
MKKIVLMPPNWLGDVILAQPALRALAHHYKDEALQVFGRGWLPDLLPFLNLEHDDVTYVDELPKRTDAAFLFPNSLRSALQSFKSRAKQRIGFRREGRGVFLTHPYTSRIDLIHEHHRGYYLDLLQQHGVPTPFDAVELATPQGEKLEAVKQLKAHGINPDKYICVAPGAQFGGAKRYPAESYAYVLSWLSDEGWDVVVLGTPAESDIAKQCVSKVKGNYWNACGETSLRQALQLVSATHLMLCNDSGLMHVAAGMGIPTVTMFGATDPARTSPSGKKVTVLYKPASCSPCLQRECDAFGHPCMGNILPEMVRDACLDFLKP